MFKWTQLLNLFIYCCCLVTESCLTLVTPWTVAYQAALSMGFPSQEYWSGVPFPSPGDFPTQWLSRISYVSYIAGGLFIAETPGLPMPLAVRMLACHVASVMSSSLQPRKL